MLVNVVDEPLDKEHIPLLVLCHSLRTRQTSWKRGLEVSELTEAWTWLKASDKRLRFTKATSVYIEEPVATLYLYTSSWNFVIAPKPTLPLWYMGRTTTDHHELLIVTTPDSIHAKDSFFECVASIGKAKPITILLNLQKYWNVQAAVNVRLVVKVWVPINYPV